MSYQNILVEVRDTTQIITLNRPKVLNSLNTQVRGELDQAFTEAETNKGIRAVVVTGSGRAFAAGKDVPEFIGQGGDGMSAISRADHKLFFRILNFSKPVIAAINGFALGGGLELAMSCHIRVAAESAVMGQPEIALGAIPGAGGTQLLPRLVGRGIALYYLLTGENINTQEAYRLGLVDKVVPDDKLMINALAIAKVIGQKAPIAARLILEGVNCGMELNLEKGLELEEELWRKCGQTEDFNEAIKAFTEKRTVVFKGR